jgi:hypothetical protein
VSRPIDFDALHRPRQCTLSDEDEDEVVAWREAGRSLGGKQASIATKVGDDTRHCRFAVSGGHQC